MSSANRDRRWMLRFAGALFAAILLVSWLSPDAADVDPSPTTFNSGVAGSKALFLLLPRLGYPAERWDEGPGRLRAVDAGRTTLVLAEPRVPEGVSAELKAEIAGFLERGGRVLVTGAEGAALVPGGSVKKAGGLYKGLCLTTPEGQGALARAGAVSLAPAWAWSDAGVQSRVEQRCGADAVVVEEPVGQGAVVWWASAMPLTNRGLKEDASLRLVLASVGAPGRRVLFDESFHGEGATIWDTVRGLPLAALAAQVGLVGVLLVLSFGRRNGPVLEPVRVVRSSPLEFAESVGHLYQKAGATAAATEGARRRLMRLLGERCGVSAAALAGGGAAVVEAVEQRLGGEWRLLGEHLDQAAAAEHERVGGASALRLVRALDEDRRRLEERVSGKRERESA